jgi:LysM repeat protein
VYKIKTVKKYYTVRSGDNLYNIAKRNGCTVKELMSWNNLRSSRINVGKRLELRKEVRELVPAVVEKVEAALPARQDQSVSRIPILLTEDVQIETMQKQISFEIEPELPVQTDNSIILKRRQSLRQALGSTQLGISTSQIVLPNGAAAGDVIKWRTKA